MDREHLETITRVLAPLTGMLVQDPIGASADDLALIETEFGLPRLPGMVQAFLPIVGRDDHLVQMMFAGEAPFHVGALLGDARDALTFAAELGAPEPLLRCGLPCSGTAEYQSWIGVSEQALGEDRDDPHIWAIVEGGVLERGPRFAEDIAKRVEWAWSGLRDLRDGSTAAFPIPSPDTSLRSSARRSTRN